MQKGLALAVLTMAMPLAAQQQQTITCRSTGGQQFCPANTVNGVRLVRERSDGLCQQGSTWSFNRTGITVNGGCSAEFEVSGANGNGNNGYGTNGYNGSGNQNGNGNQNDGQGYGNGNQRNGNQGNGQGYGNRNRGVVIPSGTQLSVRIEQNVRPAEINANETIAGSLTNDVSVDGNVIAPAGTPVQAQIDSAQGSTFNLRLTSMTVNGRTYALSTNSVHSLRDAANAGDTSNQSTKKQFGSILGNIATGGQIASGTVFNFRLTSTAQSSGRNGNSQGGGYNNNNQ